MRNRTTSARYLLVQLQCGRKQSAAGDNQGIGTLPGTIQKANDTLGGSGNEMSPVARGNALLQAVGDLSAQPLPKAVVLRVGNQEDLEQHLNRYQRHTY